MYLEVKPIKKYVWHNFYFILYVYQVCVFDKKISYQYPDWPNLILRFAFLSFSLSQSQFLCYFLSQTISCYWSGQVEWKREFWLEGSRIYPRPWSRHQIDFGAKNVGKTYLSLHINYKKRILKYFKLIFSGLLVLSKLKCISVTIIV